ncbi:MAG: hypothetical protein ABI760_13470 [Ferruginibacter sp.]
MDSIISLQALATIGHLTGVWLPLGMKALQQRLPSSGRGIELSPQAQE